MDYEGKLYGRAGKSYFLLEKTSQDFEALKKNIEYHAGIALKNLNAIREFQQENISLKLACKELLTAMEQYNFFANGYSNGSASISEVNVAAEDQSKAYSKLWDIVNKLK